MRVLQWAGREMLMRNDYTEKGPGWLAAPLPEDEDLRLQTLRDYEVLDTPKEEAFDSIVSRVAERFRVPVVAISLIDDSRQWFKSCLGLDCHETPREQAFCAHALLEDTVMIVLDASEDFRFRGNPLVTGEPFVRFYAGAPIVAPNGMKIGVLCIMDDKPRGGFSFKDAALLCSMAGDVAAELERRRRLDTCRSSL